MKRVAVLLAGLILALAACGDSGGKQAVSYTAATMSSGDKVSLSSLSGHPAVLVSWATWCTECDKELGALQSFAQSPAADGLKIVAVNLDAADVQDEIDAKVERHHLSVELWRDRRNGFKSAFGALGVPTTVVLDRGGTVVGTFPGAVDFSDAAVVAAIDTARKSS